MAAPGFREFVADPQAPFSDHVWHDTCGEYAIDFAEAKAKGIKATPEEMLVLTHDMVAHHEHDHGTTPAGLVDELHRRELTCTLVENKTADEYHAAVLAAKDAGKGVVVFITLGQNLVDVETGIGYSYRTPWQQDTKNHPLEGHYVFVDHAQANGYVCADGANPQAFTRYAVYTWATLVKSQIAALIIVDVKENHMDYGTQLGPGFAAYVKQHNVSAKLLVPESGMAPGEVFAVFDNGLVLYWSQATDVRDDMAGHVIVTLLNRPAPAAPAMPAELSGLLSDLGNLLSPYINLSTELTKLNNILRLPGGFR